MPGDALASVEIYHVLYQKGKVGSVIWELRKRPPRPPQRIADNIYININKYNSSYINNNMNINSHVPTVSPKLPNTDWHETMASKININIHV